MYDECTYPTWWLAFGEMTFGCEQDKECCKEVQEVVIVKCEVRGCF